MLSRNEYSQLKTVIVGDATGAKIPAHDISLRCVNYADKSSDDQLPTPGPYPKQVIDESNEDIAKFIQFLEGESVNVLRPDPKHDPEYYTYCPRDTVFVHGDKVLFTPMALRARAQEFQAYIDLFKPFDVRKEVVMIDRDDNLYNDKCIGDPNVLALNETVNCFDAANVLRHNDDIYYLVSNSGNKKGAEYLQGFLGNEVKVHTLEDVYSYMHLDSTIAFLRDGLLLVNPSRIKDKEQLPKSLQDWDIIWAPEPVEIGHYPGLCNSSPWLSINLLSINEKLVVLEEHQHNLRQELEKHGIECAMLPLRHAVTLGGCFHCITADVERQDV
jgi:glycine amidinotransferase/scyllo-inosamine-4-phosphate amidinotransferase 1